MIKKILPLVLISLSLHATAAVVIQEELYVVGLKPEVVRDLVDSRDVEIDHVTSEGFEIYGAKGLSQILDSRNIVTLDMKAVKNKMLAEYPTYIEFTARMQAIAAKRPDLIKLFSIGKTVKGRDMWMVKISDNVDKDEVEPEFKFISSMHGDEITGRELTTSLIEEMINNYGKNSELTDLMNNTEIYIMPSMNPDGSELKQRANAKGIDLNRSFPEFVDNDANKPEGRPIEVQNVMKFQGTRQFALSANFHGGTIVANYPWDSRYDRHPLNDLAMDISHAYADLNPEMRSSSEFSGGITNGADWYIVKGGMQDWSYIWYNDLQITLEVSHSKYPSYSQIPGFYVSNRDSMVAYMKRVHQGAGFRLDRSNVEGTVIVKQLTPSAREMGSFGFNNSEFYKVLPEGTYELTVNEKNGKSQKISVSVENEVIRGNGNYISLK